MIRWSMEEVADDTEQDSICYIASDHFHHFFSSISRFYNFLSTWSPDWILDWFIFPDWPYQVATKEGSTKACTLMSEQRQYYIKSQKKIYLWNYIQNPFLIFCREIRCDHQFYNIFSSWFMDIFLELATIVCLRKRKMRKTILLSKSYFYIATLP